MVIRILLLLLSALFPSQCEKYHIDLNQCGISTDCYVRESCIDHKDNQATLVKFANQPLKTGGCDVIIQIRPFTKKKYHYIVQINASESTETIAKSGVSLKQGDVQFECKEDGPTGKAALFDIVKLGDYTYEDNLVLCSFTMEDKSGKKITDNFEDNFDVPVLEFSQTSLKTLQYAGNKDKFWAFPQSLMYCNPEKLQSADSFTDGFLREKVSIYSFPPIVCAPPKALEITRDNSLPTILETGESLTCENEKWTYKESSATVQIIESESFHVACAAKFCSLCTPLDRLDCKAGCSPFKEESKDEGCLTATCSSNAWMINDGQVVDASEIECKQEIELPYSRNGNWYLKTNNDSLKVTKAACFDKAVCWTPPKFRTHCKNNFECGSLNSSIDQTDAFCNEGFKLLYGKDDENDKDAAKLDCDFSVAQLKDEKTGTFITNEYTIYCVGKPRKDDPAGDNVSAANTTTIVGGAVGGGLLLLGIVVVVIFMIRRSRAPKTEVKTDTGPHIPTVQEDVANKILPSRNRKPWATRVRKWEEIVPNIDLMERFNHGDFGGRILPEFVQYSLQNRKNAIYQITAFNKYANVEGDDNKADYGTFNQFWLLFKQCEDKNMDCWITWDILWRTHILIHGLMELSHIEGDFRLDKRMKAQFIKSCKPVLDELGWKIKPGEDETDTQMRMFYVRVLLWSDEPEVIAELKRQADLPIDELESPLRAVVFSFAARQMARGREMRKKYWKTIKANPENEEKDKFGTMRQHLLYGICSHIDYKKKKKKLRCKVMENVLEKLFDFDPMSRDSPWTAMDMHWAYRGATEYFSNMEWAIKAFIESIPDDINDRRDMHVNCKYEIEVREATKRQFMKSTMDTIYLLAESCSYDTEYEDFSKALAPLLDYCEHPSGKIDHEKQLYERATNLNLVLIIDGKNNRKKADKIYHALTKDEKEKSPRQRLAEEMDRSFKSYENIEKKIME